MIKRLLLALLVGGPLLTNAATAAVESIKPADMMLTIRKTSGVLVMQLTAQDPNCSHCVAAIPRLDELAQRHPTAARYVRVSWQRWGEAFNDRFVQSQGIDGLPIYLAFENGELIHRVYGNASLAELEKIFQRNPASLPKTQAPSDITYAQLEEILKERRKEWAASGYGKNRNFKPSPTLVVQFTSRDPSCAQCVAAIANFDALAARVAATSHRFLRVTKDPWGSAASEQVIRDNRIQGLPTVLPFKMGMRRGTMTGNYEPIDLLDFLVTIEGSSLDMDMKFIGKEERWQKFGAAAASGSAAAPAPATSAPPRRATPASPATPASFGSLGDPFTGAPVILDTYPHTDGAARVTSRYVVREGKQLDLPRYTRAQLIELQRMCAAGKPGTTVVPESAFPQKLLAIRQEDYLSETARLSVQITAFVTLVLSDCSIKWDIKHTGTLSRYGTQRPCKLDYDKRTYSGGCETPGTSYFTDPPSANRDGVSPPPSKQIAGQTCYVIATPMATALAPGGSACTWFIEPAQRAHFPGLLSRNLMLELDYGDNGKVVALEAEASRPLDARLFAIPPGFTARR